MAFDSRILTGVGVLSAVVEAGSFVRAGDALGLTQSGVSRAIARLEERVGVRLLQRNARALTLTEEGERFYRQAVPLLHGLEDVANEATAGASAVRGRLRVATDSLAGRTLITPGLPRLLTRFPELELDLVAREQFGDLLGEGFDLGVGFGEPAPSTLIARKLLETRVVTCASRAYLERHGRPRHPRDLADHECILFRDPRTGRPFEWVFERAGETISAAVKGRLCVNDSATGLAACLAGLGIAQPLELQLRDSRSKQLVPILTRWSDERFPLYVYYPSRRLPSARVRAFLEFVISAAQG